MHGGIFFNDDQGDSVTVRLCRSDARAAMKSIQSGGGKQASHRTMLK